MAEIVDSETESTQTGVEISCTLMMDSGCDMSRYLQGLTPCSTLDSVASKYRSGSLCLSLHALMI